MYSNLNNLIVEIVLNTFIMKQSLFYFLSFLFLSTSCKSVRQILSQKITTQKACTDLTFDGKMPLISLEIDQTKTKFMFDTGATFTIVIDSSVVPDFINKDFSSLGYAKGADRKKIKNRLLPVEIHSDIFESKNKVVAYIKSPPNKCRTKPKSYTGIIGMDFFFDKKTSLLMDFSTNNICNIDAEELSKKLDGNTYTLVKSECKNSQIFIFIVIEGKEYKFKLDTGYSGNIIIPNSETLTFTNPNKIELEGSTYQTVSSLTSGKEIYYEKMPVTFGKFNLETKISVSGTIKAQNVGIEFIKGFDWIIDYNKNKVYIKRNQTVIPYKFDKNVIYFAKANENGLYVVVKEKNQSKYAIGDQITSINNVKVTPENICEMQELLNDTKDWNTLTLEIIPVTK